MLPEIGAALISAGGSLFSGAMNTFGGQAMSKDLMDYQYQLQQKGIEDQRAYNSPQAQMERLRAAGLSPNLVYGNGVDGNQSGAASPAIANRRGEFENPMQDAVQQYNIERQLRLQEIKNRNEAFESRERQLKLRAETLGQMLDNSYNDQTMETRIKSLSQKLALDLQKQYNMEADEALTWSRTRNEDNRLAEIWANVDLLKARKHLTDEQAATEIVRRGSLAAGIRLTNAQVNEVAHRILNTDAGTALRTQEYDIKQTEFESDEQLQQWLAEHPNWAMTNQVTDLIIDKIGRALGGSRSVRKRRSNKRKH